MRNSFYTFILLCLGAMTLLPSKTSAQTYVDMSSASIAGVNSCNPSYLTWSYNAPNAGMYMNVGCRYTSTVNFSTSSDVTLNVTAQAILCMPLPSCMPNYTLVVNVDGTDIGTFYPNTGFATYTKDITSGSHVILYTIDGATSGGVQTSAYYYEVTTAVQPGLNTSLIASSVSEDGVIHVEGVSPEEITVTDVNGRSEVLKGNDVKTSLKGILMVNVMAQGEVYRQKVWVK